MRSEKPEVFESLGSQVEGDLGFIQSLWSALPLWEKGEGPRSMMIQDIPSILSRKRGVPDHRVVYYLLMDGMRWDLWESIKSDFFGKMPNHFRFVREGALWANQPTDTSAQLTLFEQAFRAVHGGLDHAAVRELRGRTFQFRFCEALAFPGVPRRNSSKWERPSLQRTYYEGENSGHKKERLFK